VSFAGRFDIASAILGLFGTVTVLSSFVRTAKVVEEVREGLKDTLGEAFKGGALVKGLKHDAALGKLANRIGWSWWIFAGLIAYIIAAGLAIWAGALS
jgi:hypothetical protein